MFLEKTIAYITNYLQTNGLAILKERILAGIVFVIIYIVIKQIVKRVKTKILANSLMETDEYNQKVANLLGKIIYTTLMVFNILIVFQMFGFNVAILMGGISLAIGFAMESTIGNMISGILILTHKKIHLGDKLEFFGTINLVGVVEEINIKHCVLRTIDGRKMVLPNSIIRSTPFKTIKDNPTMRGEIECKVPRHVDIPQVKGIIKQTINSHPELLNKEWTDAIVAEFDKHGIKMKGFYFFSPEIKKTQFVLNSELRTILSQTFKKYGIDVPYQHITINVE